MPDNFSFSPGSGAEGAAKNIGGVLYPKVIATEIDGSDTALAAKLGSLTETAPTTDTASSGLNGRLQRIAQRLTSLIALIPALGQSTKSGSLPVTLASDDDVQGKLGSLTETAPATDTASSGLNGRLQRVAQRLTSLIALLPTSLGANGGLKVDGSGTALPVSGTVTANAGTNLNTSALALETGGNLATIAGAVTSSKVAVKAASGDFADGSIATIGTKADAKNSASDTTAITIMSVLKQVSFSIQAAAASLAGTLTVGTHAVTQSGTWNVTVNAAIAAGTNIIGKFGIDQTTPGTTNGVTPVPAVSGGPTVARIKAAASTNATSVKASAGQIYGWAFFNNTTNARYVKIYNKASSPTVGTDTPAFTIIVPGATGGSGTNVEFSMGIPLGTGIAYAITGAIADSDTTSVSADDVHGVLLYK